MILNDKLKENERRLFPDIVKTESSSDRVLCTYRLGDGVMFESEHKVDVNVPLVSQLDCTDLINYIMESIGDIEVDEDEIVTEPVVDIRNKTLVDSLAHVGIVSDSIPTTPRFYPHNRDICNLTHAGEFSFRGETVESFEFPVLGAQKMGTHFSAIGVASTAGVLASGVFTDIIDAAREKLDGEECIVYRIRTRNYVASFYWGPATHEMLPEPVAPGHFELVDGQLYFLSGFNSQGGIVHEWQYLTEDLVNSVKGKEGLIVRMSGKEYRLPWELTATFMIRDGVASDSSGSITFRIPGVKDGLYDCVYRDKNWEVGKRRRDKVRADAAGGIRDMLNNTVTLGTFLRNVQIGKRKGFTPAVVRLVLLSEDRIEKIKQCKDLKTVKVRATGGYRQPDSYRRILMEDKGLKDIGTYALCLTRANVIMSCGRVFLLRRHYTPKIYLWKGNEFTNCAAFGVGKVFHLPLKKPSHDSLNSNRGPYLRLYRLDWRRMALYLWERHRQNLGDLEAIRKTFVEKGCGLE